MAAPAPLLRALLAALLVGAVLPGETPAGPAGPLSARIDAAVARFDATIAALAIPVQRSLDDWRADRRRQALAELAALLGKTTGDDQAYVAWALVAANPRNGAARAVLTKAGKRPPCDERGVTDAGAIAPQPSDRALIERVAALAYPPFEVVAKIVQSEAVRAYRKRQRVALDGLKDELIGLARSDPDPHAGEAAFALLAYYHPRAPEVAQHWQQSGTAMPRNRTWFNPVDRWLLDHELAGIDCLRGKPDEGQLALGDGKQPVALDGACAWRFPAHLGNCRLELLLRTASGSEPHLRIVDDHGAGLDAALAGSDLVLREAAAAAAAPLARCALGRDPSGAPIALQLEVRGDRVSALVAGATIATCRLGATHAYSRLAIAGAGASAQQLRLRFLAELPQPALAETAVAAAAKPQPPAEPWRVERDRQLAQSVSFACVDQPLEEVIALLTQISGVPFALDDHAATLKDLPVTLSGSQVALGTALGWLTRLTDVEFVPTAEGLTCTWKG